MFVNTREFHSDRINTPHNAMTLLPAAHEAFGHFRIAFEPTAALTDRVGFSSLSNHVTPSTNRHAQEQRYKLLRWKPNNRPAVLDVLMDGKLDYDGNDRFLSFCDHSEGKYALPDPALLQAHATIAKIVHACRMAEYVEKILRDLEDIGVMAEDGSTALDGLSYLSGIAV